MDAARRRSRRAAAGRRAADRARCARRGPPPAPRITRPQLAAHRRLASDSAPVRRGRGDAMPGARSSSRPRSATPVASTSSRAPSPRRSTAWSPSAGSTCVELAAPSPATVARFERRGGTFLRWAAAIAERHAGRRAADAGARAVAARGRARGRAADDARPPRPAVPRAADEDELAAAYAEWARAEPDERCAAALWCARGIVDLARGDFVEAEESLRHAARARAARSVLPRRARRRVPRGQALRPARPRARRAGDLADEPRRPRAGRARVRGAARRAPRRSRGRARRARADDRGAPRRRRRDARARQAVRSRRALGCARSSCAARPRRSRPPPERRAEIWIDIARARGAPRRHRRRARRARRAPPRTRTPRRCASRRASTARPATSSKRSRSCAPSSRPIRRSRRRMQLQTELAQLLTELGREPEAVVAAYLDVLSVEPDQTEALAGIEAPARALGLWDELARAFRGAPQTPRNLEVLAEALAKIAEWSELAEVRRRQLEAATAARRQGAARRRARRAVRARARRPRRRDPHAARSRRPRSPRRRSASAICSGCCARLERWPEVAAALERELPAVRRHRRSSARSRSCSSSASCAPTSSTARPRPCRRTRACSSASPSNPVALGRARGALRADSAAIASSPACSRRAPRRRPIRSARGAAVRARRDAAREPRRHRRRARRVHRRVRRRSDQPRRVHRDGARLLQGRALGRGDAALRERDRARRERRRRARTGSAICTRAAATSSSTSSARSTPRSASYQKVVEVDSQPAGRGEDPRGAVQAARRLAAADRRVREARRDAARSGSARPRRCAPRPQLASGPRERSRAVDAPQPQAARDRPDGRRGAVATLERYYEDAQDKIGPGRRPQAAARARAGRRRVGRAAQADRARLRGGRARRRHARPSTTRRSSSSQPENRDALDALGRIYESTEQWAEFIDVTRRQIKVTTDRNTKALLYFKCGSVMEAKFGREHDAIRYYDAAIKTSPACLPAVHGLRDLYRRREEWPRVIETLELEVKLWQDDKERAGVFAQIGRIYEKQLGDAERAMQLLRERARRSIRTACRRTRRCSSTTSSAASGTRRSRSRSALAQKAMRDGDPTTRSEFYRKRGVVARMTGDPRARRRELHRRARDQADQHRRARRSRRARARAARRLGLRRDLPRAREALPEARRRRPAARARPRRPRRDRRARRRSRPGRRAVPRRRSSSRPATSRCCRRSSTSTPTCGAGRRRSTRSSGSSARTRRPPRIGSRALHAPGGDPRRRRDGCRRARSTCSAT